MDKQQENTDRVDKDAYEREQDRLRRERETIGEMSGEDAEKQPAPQKQEE